MWTVLGLGYQKHQKSLKTQSHMCNRDKAWTSPSVAWTPNNQNSKAANLHMVSGTPQKNDWLGSFDSTELDIG